MLWDYCFCFIIPGVSNLPLKGYQTPLTHIGSYLVKVHIQQTTQQTVLLTPATAEDMPNNWSFAWSELWQKTDFDCQNIIKLVYNDEVWGLVRYGLYPYHDPYTDPPKYIEVEHLEGNPQSRGKVANRFLEPIGKWLIWYATKVGLQYCQVTDKDNDPLVVLVALEQAVFYYRDKVQMEYLGCETIAPGEEGYGFRFLKKAATAFCQRHESQWGEPKQL